MSHTQTFNNATEIDFAAISDGAKFVLPETEQERFEQRYKGYLRELIARTNPKELEAGVMEVITGAYDKMQGSDKPEGFATVQEALASIPQEDRQRATIFALMDHGVLEKYEEAIECAETYFNQHGFNKIAYHASGQMGFVFRVTNSATGQSKIAKLSNVADGSVAKGEDLAENLRPLNDQNPEDMPEGWQLFLFEEALILYSIRDQIGLGKKFMVKFADDEGNGDFQPKVIPGRFELFRHMLENSITKDHFLADEADANTGYHPDTGVVFTDMGAVRPMEGAVLSSQWGAQRRLREAVRREIYGALGPLSHLAHDNRELAVHHDISLEAA